MQVCFLAFFCCFTAPSGHNINTLDDNVIKSWHCHVASNCTVLSLDNTKCIRNKLKMINLIFEKGGLRTNNSDLQNFFFLPSLQWSMFDWNRFLYHVSIKPVSLFSGRLGENMSVRRAVTLAVPAEWNIGSYVHGGVSGQTEVVMGRYGTLVVFQGGKEGEQEVLGRKLGQHIVGEAPVSLGNMDDLPCGESETRLLPQTFLVDPSRTVAQFLLGQQARVLDFVRFQCGEAVSEEAKWGERNYLSTGFAMCLYFIRKWHKSTQLTEPITLSLWNLKWYICGPTSIGARWNYQSNNKKVFCSWNLCLYYFYICFNSRPL